MFLKLHMKANVAKFVYYGKIQLTTGSATISPVPLTELIKGNCIFWVTSGKIHFKGMLPINVLQCLQDHFQIEKYVPLNFVEFISLVTWVPRKLF